MIHFKVKQILVDSEYMMVAESDIQYKSEKIAGLLTEMREHSMQLRHHINPKTNLLMDPQFSKKNNTKLINKKKIEFINS